jgi:uncharacterized protein YecE (DUF72 family)
MATRLHVGAKELKGDLAAYAKRFDLLEVRGVDAKLLKQAPSASTLRKWRKAVPPQFEFSVVAGPNIGKLKPSPALDAELAALLETIEILQARVIVLPTPPDVTPSKLSRDRVAKVLEKLPRDASAVVWEPSGLWENEDAADQAKAWDVVLGVDPARDALPAGPVCYGRMRAVGGTRAFSTAALQKIADKIGERRDAYVIIETTGALKEAKTLRGLVRQAKTGTKGGLSRLIRPKKGAPLDVGDDDEQEEE